jgi:hypothetical protein
MVTTNAHAKRNQVRKENAPLDEVFSRIMSGESLSSICKDQGMPTRKSFFLWVAQDEKLRARYESALFARSYVMVDELLEIADSEIPETGDGKKDWQAIQKHKLQVDTRKWLLSKLAPKKYGDKLEVSGDPTNPLVTRIERVVVKS